MWLSEGAFCGGEGWGEGARSLALAPSPRPSPPQSSLLRKQRRMWGRGGRTLENALRESFTALPERVSRHSLVVAFYPEGISAHSRWSSAATPPENRLHQPVYPGGIVALRIADTTKAAGILSGDRNCWERDSVVSLLGNSVKGYFPNKLVRCLPSEGVCWRASLTPTLAW